MTSTDWSQIAITLGPLLSALSIVITNQSRNRTALDALIVKVDGHIVETKSHFERIDTVLARQPTKDDVRTAASAAVANAANVAAETAASLLKNAA